MKVIILENIRSAYNVGNIIRTADALGRSVWICGYTPSPFVESKVRKTSLGAEDHVWIEKFWETQEAIEEARENKLTIIAAEITDKAISLQDFSKTNHDNIAVIFGNEVEGVQPQTLEMVDHVVYIPMQGIKESLNVGQSTAIFMRALR